MADRFSIKVTRLARPMQVLPIANPDIRMMNFKRTSLSPALNPIGSSLQLGASDAECYLGESVRLLIRISHNSSTPMKDTGVTIEVVTTSGQKVVLLDHTSQHERVLLAPEQMKSYVLDYQTSELGPCSVVTSISFLEDSPNGPMKKTGKKFWSFQVAKPFEITSDIHQTEAITVAEIKLQSLVESPVVLESVKLVTHGDQLSFNDLQWIPTDSGGSVFGEASAMRHKECRSLLYRIQMSDSTKAIDPELLRNIRMVVAWRSRMGQQGEIVNTLEAKNITSTNPAKEYDLVLISAPDKAQLEEPFSVTLLITSWSSNPLEIKLEIRKEKSGTIFPCGLSKRSLGMFPPRGSKEVVIDLLPLNPGVQAISGFRLSCPRTETFRDFDQLHEVEVLT